MLSDEPYSRDLLRLASYIQQVSLRSVQVIVYNNRSFSQPTAIMSSSYQNLSRVLLLADKVQLIELSSLYGSRLLWCNVYNFTKLQVPRIFPIFFPFRSFIFFMFLFKYMSVFKLIFALDVRLAEIHILAYEYLYCPSTTC